MRRPPERRSGARRTGESAPNERLSPMRKHPLLFLWLALAGAVLAAVFVGDFGGGHHKPPALTTTVDKSAAPGKQPMTVTVPKAAVKQVAATELGHHIDLRNETPPNVPTSDLVASQKKQDALAANDQLPLVLPDAAPVQRGCVSRFVRNYSTRRGVKPREWTLHFTVSPNRPGWSDVDAVVNLFNSPSSQASSNYVLDGEAHCAYIVREGDKAWTQAGGNPYSISVEVIDTGRESTYLAPAGLKKLALIISDSARRWGIPLQHGKVNGCVPVRPGIIQHKDWGQCGGGHVDIAPYSVEDVITAARNYRAGGVTSTDRVTCRKLNSWRHAGRPKGKPEANAVRRKRALAGRHVNCTPSGPVRA